MNDDSTLENRQIRKEDLWTKTTSPIPEREMDRDRERSPMVDTIACAELALKEEVITRGGNNVPTPQPQCFNLELFVF